MWDQILIMPDSIVGNDENALSTSDGQKFVAAYGFHLKWDKYGTLKNLFRKRSLVGDSNRVMVPWNTAPDLCVVPLVLGRECFCLFRTCMLRGDYQRNVLPVWLWTVHHPM